MERYQGVPPLAHRPLSCSAERSTLLPTQEQLLQRNQLLERVASMHQQRQRAEAENAAVTAESAVTWWQDERLVVSRVQCVAIESAVLASPSQQRCRAAHCSTHCRPDQLPHQCGHQPGMWGRSAMLTLMLMPC
jgi:hypothetical protein